MANNNDRRQVTTTKAEFEQVKGHKLFFGKYKGLTLNEIAKEDAGLTYLDWVVGQPWFGDTSQYPQNAERQDAVEKFLNFPPVAKDVDEAIRKDKEERSNRNKGASGNSDGYGGY